MTPNRWTPAVVTAALLVAGCGQSSTMESPPTESATDVPRIPDDPRERALAAKEELGKRLSARLLQAISKGDPAAAIPVCKTDAPQIAKEVGKEFDVAIGRTSFQLRNPANAPPQWAQELVDRRVDEPHFTDLADGRLAALLPIHLLPQCVTCHGAVDQIPDEVKATLAAQYPQDRATGFLTNDLRGWFWVEVPAKAKDTGT